MARQLRSRVSRVALSPRRRALTRALHEGIRRLRGVPHRVEYFHEVADPYSQLAAQALAELAARYDIEIVPRVAAPDTGPDIPEPELLSRLGQRDCAAIAPYYGLAFPAASRAPSSEHVRAVECALVAVQADPQEFAERATALGSALWSGDAAVLEGQLAERARASAADTERSLASARERRRGQGHYSGAMFLYAGEWYWGVDRLCHLERRLAALGAARAETPRFPRPEAPSAPVPRADELTLEIFPSLRSPYTAISFERAVKLAEQTGVGVELRPVLPMVMRGVPATFNKGMYIMSDTLREAEAMGVPFGKMLDPIGEPVRQAYSLWPFARARGKGAAYLAAFLRAAFADGIDTSTEAGLRGVVERAGLSFEDARPHLGDPAWEEELETNRLAMVGELGQWGVPSFRLRGPEGEPDLCCWGQDRLWLVAAEIQRRGGATTE